MGDSNNTTRLLKQNEIAFRSGHHQSTISKILNGDRMPSSQMAVDLELATGVCRMAWVFPEKHFNPYIPFDDAKRCNC